MSIRITARRQRRFFDAARQSEGSPGRFSAASRRSRAESPTAASRSTNRACTVRPGRDDASCRARRRARLNRAPRAPARGRGIGSVLWRAGSRRRGAAGPRPACRRRAALNRAACALRGPRRGFTGGAILAAARRGGANARRLDARARYAAARGAHRRLRGIQILAGLLERSAGPTISVLPTRKPPARPRGLRGDAGRRGAEHRAAWRSRGSLCWQDRAGEAGRGPRNDRTSPAPEMPVRGGDAPIARAADGAISPRRCGRPATALALAEQVADLSLLARAHRVHGGGASRRRRGRQVRAHVRQGIEAAAANRLPLALLRLRAVLLRALLDDTRRLRARRRRLARSPRAGQTPHPARRSSSQAIDAAAAPSARIAARASPAVPDRSSSRSFSTCAAGERRWGGGRRRWRPRHVRALGGVVCRRRRGWTDRRGRQGSRGARARRQSRRSSPAAAGAFRSPPSAARGGRTGPLRRRSGRRARLPLDRRQPGNPGARRRLTARGRHRGRDPPSCAARDAPRHRLPPCGAICSARVPPRPRCATPSTAPRGRRSPCSIEGESGSGKELVARGDPPALAAPRAALLRAQLRGAHRRPPRSRALRPRARRVHRRGDGARGAVRGGGRRHAVPRRSRRAVGARAGQAAARPPGGRGAPRRREPAAPRRRPHRRGHQPAARATRSRPGGSARPALPARRRAHRRAAAARAAAATSPLLAQHFWQRRRRPRRARARRSRPDALAALARYDWPGNVRELQNAIAWMAVHAPRRGRVGAVAPAAHSSRERRCATGLVVRGRARGVRAPLRAGRAGAGRRAAPGRRQGARRDTSGARRRCSGGSDRAGMRALP